MRHGPCGAAGPGQPGAGGQAELGAIGHRPGGQRRLAAKEMADPGDVQDQRLGVVQTHQRREPLGPAGQGAQQRLLPSGLGRAGEQIRADRPRIRQPQARRQTGR
ncbi:MAG: hypothetical protein AAFR17_16370 [Pseudomonadota bacterium]